MRLIYDKLQEAFNIDPNNLSEVQDLSSRYYFKE